MLISPIVAFVYGLKSWKAWINLGGSGPFGRSNHQHACPVCAKSWQDDDPTCPGASEFECIECWHEKVREAIADGSNVRNANSLGGFPSGISKDGISFSGRSGDLIHFKWAGRSQGTLAREKFMGVGPTGQWVIGLLLVILCWYLCLNRCFNFLVSPESLTLLQTDFSQSSML